MSSKKQFDYVPKLITKKQALQKAKGRIEEEATGKQLGLKTRFSRLNIALGKYFRFGQVTSINGLSGHGKSTMLNMILDDFQNNNINGDFPHPTIIVHNSWEMMPEDEALRIIATKTKTSFLHLLSSDYNRETNKYNKVSPVEINYIEDFINEIEDKDHYYFSEATTTAGIIMNIKTAIQYYQQKYIDKINADLMPQYPKVIVALDHTLLAIADKGQSIIDLMMELGRLAVYLKKHGYMVLFVGQFNNDIERIERIKHPENHFPIKADIYAQAQLFNACDNVLTIHQPELLGIKEYGRNKLDVSDLIHLQVLKQRFGKVGSIWLKNELQFGRVVEFNPKSNAIKK